MSLAKVKTKVSAENYLEGELVSRERHEYVAGEVFAMAGASERHHRICLNLAKALDTHLEDSDCNVFITDMKLKTAQDTFYYPDVFVACDKDPASEYYREVPVLVLEVVSPTTRQIDRREKLRAYQQAPSLQEYVVIEQDKMYIELHRRQPNGGWITHFYNDSDLGVDIVFESVGLRTNLADIYRRVKFPETYSEIEG